MSVKKKVEIQFNTLTGLVPTVWHTSPHWDFEQSASILSVVKYMALIGYCHACAPMSLDVWPFPKLALNLKIKFHYIQKYLFFPDTIPFLLISTWWQQRIQFEELCSSLDKDVDFCSEFKTLRFRHLFSPFWFKGIWTCLDL